MPKNFRGTRAAEGGGPYKGQGMDARSRGRRAAEGGGPYRRQGKDARSRGT
ncbi:MAG: hypothetical protein LBH21_06355 [Gracilibacteraceae bacterium]|nr:hypothetical protein [Gracilibacteraceae bacterium]